MQETQAIIEEHLFGAGSPAPIESAGQTTADRGDRSGAVAPEPEPEPETEIPDSSLSQLDVRDGDNGGIWMGSQAEYQAKYGTLKLEQPNYARVGEECAEEMAERIAQTFVRNKKKKEAFLEAKKTGDPCKRTSIGYFTIPEHQSKFPNWEHNFDPLNRFPPSKDAPNLADVKQKILDKQNLYQDRQFWKEQFILESNRERFVFFPKGCKDDVIQKVFPLDDFPGKRKVDTNRRENEDWKVHKTRVANESVDVAERKKFAAWRLYLKGQFKSFRDIPPTFDWCDWQDKKFLEAQNAKEDTARKARWEEACEKFGPCLVPPAPPAMRDGEPLVKKARTEE